MRFQQTGLLHHDPARSYAGFTTITPFRHPSCYLVDMAGETVHQWDLPGALGSKAYLLPGGNLLCSVATDEGAPLKAAKGGRILELDWDGNVVWEHVDHDQHHDLRRLENGNTLYIAWEELTGEEVSRVKGGVAGTERDGKIYGDVFREVTPSGDVAWEWRLADVDLDKYPLAEDCQREEWAHANSCAPANDGNFLFNFRHLDLMMIVDRGTKEIVWEQRDRSWGHQHNPEMLENGNITFFANGMNNLYQPVHSRAMELDPRTGEITWFYRDPQSWCFFSPVMGGVQRLPNGNTLINEAVTGRFFEVTHEGDMVWEFINPYFLEVPVFDAPCNACFRAYRYAPDSPEIGGRLGG